MVLLRSHEGRWNAFRAAARAGLSRLKLWQWIAVAILGAVALYYLSIPIIGRHYTQVCRKGENGGADHCESWDVVWAFVVWLAWRADEHNGLVAACAGVAVAGFTAVLWQSTEKLWTAGEKQYRLAYTEFAASHGPRLRIRNIVVNEIGNSRIQPPPPIRIKQMLDGQLFISNIGGSSAAIVESCCIAYATYNRLPMVRPYEGRDGEGLTLFVTSLAPGFTATGKISVTLETDMMRLGQDLDLSRVKFFVMGWVDYIDEAQIRRRVAYCRKYNHETGRFGTVDDPDYEYD